LFKENTSPLQAIVYSRSIWQPDGKWFEEGDKYLWKNATPEQAAKLPVPIMHREYQ